MHPALRLPLILVLTLSWAAAGFASPDDDTPRPANLRLASVAAAVGPLGADSVTYAKHAGEVLSIASITKLMTAMVVLDSGRPLDEWVTVVERDEKAPNNAYSRIRIGSQLKRGDLIRIALMSSENRAAYVLSRDYPGGREAFVDAMNAKARSLGMNDTRFVDSSGLSPENRSTASDLLKMVRAAFGYERIREYSTTAYFRARFRKPRYSLSYGNTNPLVKGSRWDVNLSKTGYLREAGRCLVMVTRIDGEDMAMVLLDSFGTRTPLGDAGRVKRWMTTGDGGRVAGAALRYERKRTEALQQALTASN
ncbi:D-alanyl-D-alanine endopeptidase [Ectothiorhodospiraceae bacterium WFHF3C12]|nr:D-alanyl-D-alanine endopeptidase [Ectothiorhodospiraceae bacterium WFHF3C12]